MSNKVVTRIAPSPTGHMHIGTVRTALFNYLWAKKNNGDFVVRIEDTDTARNRTEWIDIIWSDFDWCGLTPDKKYIQSQHLKRHRELLEKLIEEGKAFVSKEPAKDDRTQMAEVIRLKNPGKDVTFKDEIRGDITFNTADLGDFVIARSLDAPLYHFAVVVDDADAGVSHVIRGEDILSSTPRQILIQEALGLPRPIYVHLPLILGKDGKKLSKRRHVVALDAYRDAGFMPQGILNYLALVGWNPGTEEEYFSLDQLCDRFSLEGLQKSGAVFDDVKLKSVNQYWMRQLTDEEYIGRLNDFDQALDLSNIGKIVPLLKERAQTFGEARDMLKGELSFLFAPPSVSKEGLLKKEPETAEGAAKAALEGALEALGALGSEVSAEAAKEALMPLAEAQEEAGKGGRGAALWALRYALSGQDRSPDPFTIIFILGTDEALSRVRAAIAILEG